MYCFKEIAENTYWVGGNDRRPAMFEGVYPVPRGVSYNSYLITDESTVLVDTVDKSVGRVFFENIEHILNGRKLDYLIIQHMEPDHSATAAELLRRYPELTIVCNSKTAAMFEQFYSRNICESAYIVGEGDILSTGSREFSFLMAPMVHWPEVMVTYEKTTKTLFSADAFGVFGALNGAVFADEVDFERDYLDEARRYYTNIVGKYGAQVQALLKKAAAVEIEMLCPLHGFVWRKNIGNYIEKYSLWSSYTPEEKGVVIAYGSIYGDTENAAEILSMKLRESGIKTLMFDVSVTHPSEIIAAAFRYSHLVFASATYNAGIFVKMEDLLRDIAAHNLRKRTVAFIENGSWAATSGKLMREMFVKITDTRYIDETLSIKSALREEQLSDIERLADAIATDIKQSEPAEAPTGTAAVDNAAMFKLSYGLFVLTAKCGEKDNGCIINTVQQVTSNPNRISVTVNKQNYTHDMIKKSGVFNVSVLTTEAPFKVFEAFGFKSGRDTDKFAECPHDARSENGLRYVSKYTNAFISARVIEERDLGTHTLFIADVTEAKILSDVSSVTYQYYFDNIKPKPIKTEEKKKGFVCKICGYVYEGETLPPDFICPLCKHGAEDFEPIA